MIGIEYGNIVDERYSCYDQELWKVIITSVFLWGKTVPLISAWDRNTVVENVEYLTRTHLMIF